MRYYIFGQLFVQIWIFTLTYFTFGHLWCVVIATRCRVYNWEQLINVPKAQMIPEVRSQISKELKRRLHGRREKKFKPSFLSITMAPVTLWPASYPLCSFHFLKILRKNQLSQRLLISIYSLTVGGIMAHRISAVCWMHGCRRDGRKDHWCPLPFLQNIAKRRLKHHQGYYPSWLFPDCTDTFWQASSNLGLLDPLSFFPFAISVVNNHWFTWSFYLE